MRIIPTTKQWENWTLPSKASYIGVLIGILAIFLSIFFVMFNPSEKGSTVNIEAIKDNRNTQVNVNSPNSKQIINNERRIKKEVTIHKEIQSDGAHLTKIILSQTDGVWDQGGIFRLQVQLSNPYTEYKFIQGFPPMTSNVRESSNAAKTFFSFETTTAPLKGPIILQITSQADVDIKSITVSPLELEP
jgi:hypothetical protein